MAEVDPEGAETRALDALVDLRGLDLVEIGAGDGRLTLRLADRARSVVALEPVESSVARARRTMPRALRGRVSFELADATTYAFPRNKFDLAVLSYSL